MDAERGAAPEGATELERDALARHLLLQHARDMSATERDRQWRAALKQPKVVGYWRGQANELLSVVVAARRAADPGAKVAEVAAPPDLDSSEWGRNLFRGVIGESYKPHVWGHHRALHHASIRSALDMADRTTPEAADVLRAMIWRQVIVDNRAAHARQDQREAEDKLAAAEARAEAAERERDSATAVLRRVEWSATYVDPMIDSIGPGCPICQTSMALGYHKPGCPLAAQIGGTAREGGADEGKNPATDGTTDPTTPRDGGEHGDQ